MAWDGRLNLPTLQPSDLQAAVGSSYSITPRLELKDLSLVGAQAAPAPDGVAGLLQILMRYWVPEASFVQAVVLQPVQIDQGEKAASEKKLLLKRWQGHFYNLLLLEKVFEKGQL